VNSLTTDNLGKCYSLSNTGEGSAGPPQWLRSLPQWIRTGRRPSFTRPAREFWALRGVSFAVEPGTILGVIGPNGAGKSTLLKIIARIITPTTGRVIGVGRVVSLLELGAGFNPEISARENILMNAAMYGIARAEVLRHLDEIIAFAEIEKFIHHPLKFFSSGMYLRLAFSVAINMKPSILLADEILAVGDLGFQERCLERVGQLAKQGLTVLFVSHDMDAVMRVCERVMWLNAGQIVKSGDPEEVITEYQNAAWASAGAAKSERGRHVNRYGELIGARLVSAAGKEIGAAPLSQDVFIRIRFAARRGGLRKIHFGFDLFHRNNLIFRSMSASNLDINQAGFYEARGRIPAETLAELQYSVHAFVIFEHEGKEYSLITYNAVTFLTYSTNEADKGRLLKGALLAPKLDWHIAQPVDAV
jgi:homopolymeric O-antigen transport system ATP-binding protein